MTPFSLSTLLNKPAAFHTEGQSIAYLSPSPLLSYSLISMENMLFSSLFLFPLSSTANQQTQNPSSFYFMTRCLWDLCGLLYSVLFSSLAPPDSSLEWPITWCSRHPILLCVWWGGRLSPFIPIKPLGSRALGMSYRLEIGHGEHLHPLEHDVLRCWGTEHQHENWLNWNESRGTGGSLCTYTVWIAQHVYEEGLILSLSLKLIGSLFIIEIPQTLVWIVWLFDFQRAEPGQSWLQSTLL